MSDPSILFFNFSMLPFEKEREKEKISLMTLWFVPVTQIKLPLIFRFFFLVVVLVSFPFSFPFQYRRKKKVGKQTIKKKKKGKKLKKKNFTSRWEKRKRWNNQDMIVNIPRVTLSPFNLSLSPPCPLPLPSTHQASYRRFSTVPFLYIVFLWIKFMTSSLKSIVLRVHLDFREPVASSVAQLVEFVTSSQYI